MKDQQPLLGILVDFNLPTDPPFPEKEYYKILSLNGREDGIPVIVFSARDIDWVRKRTFGYHYSERHSKWVSGNYPLPTLIYDRLFYRGRSHMAKLAPFIKRLRTEQHLVWLNRGLPGKWPVYHVLKDQPLFARFLPDTTLFNPGSIWRKKLNRYRTLFLKPSSGSQGIGVLKISLSGKYITVTGRQSLNSKKGNPLFTKIFTNLSSCEAWLRLYTGRRQYIIQPYLALTTPQGFPFDLRILVQKNREGEWALTGQVIRLGLKNGLVANLHGGGTAVEANSFLKQHYSVQQLNSIAADLEILVTHLPLHLEKKYGSLCELGIDVGLEPDGKVWLLEVNSKPGRRSFFESGDQKALSIALTSPLKYASYMLQHTRGA